MTNVVIYTRFSPRRNADESESCETQAQLCREHAEERGWTVRAVYADEGVSGKEVHREGLEAALADLKRGDVLLVYRADRLARDLFLSELIRRRVDAVGAMIRAVEGELDLGDTPEAVFIRQVFAAVYELARKQNAARTKAAMLSQQRSGKRVGRFAPYGWQIDPDDRTRLIQQPSELPAISRALELEAEGLSAYQIAKQLDQELPDLARGKKGWSTRTVKKILARGLA